MHSQQEVLESCFRVGAAAPAPPDSEPEELRKRVTEGAIAAIAIGTFRYDGAAASARATAPGRAKRWEN